MIAKILVFLFIFSLLNLIREGYILAKDIKMNINYSVSNLRIAGIGITLAYIITFLIMGI